MAPKTLLCRLLGALLAVALLVGAPGAAMAGENPQLAKELFDEAKELHEQGKTREALAKLKQALEAFDHDGIRLSIANRHLDLGEPEEAAEYLSQVQDDGLNRTLRKEKKRLEKEVEKALSEPVEVKMTADPDGAEVSIDQGPWQKLPLSVKIKRGKHRFQFRAKGRKPVELTKTLKGMEAVPVHVALEQPPGSWRVEVKPEGALRDVRVVFDGKQVNLDAAERQGIMTAPREVKPGVYKINCLRGIDELVSTEVTVSSGQDAVATCEFAEPVDDSELKTILAWSSAGAALAAIGAGIGVWVSYEDDLSTVEELNAAAGASDRYQINSTSKPAGSGVLWAAGAGLGVVSALLFAGVI